MTTTLEKSAAAAHWKRVGLGHHHGINVPLFSLWTKESCGVGEYLDLIPLIDWCKKVGFDLIQLLPLNDSGPDASPYNALSSCALHPHYISLRALPGWEQDSELRRLVEELSERQPGPLVEWDFVRERKRNFFNRYKELHYSTVAQSADYQTFVKENRWLRPYAEFKVLRERFDGLSWKEWPKDHTPPEQDLIEKHLFLQYLAFNQMAEVKRSAESKGIFIKGDIPILISPESADVWHAPDLFDHSECAGAPPDCYSEEGQKWGFPLFDWEKMEEDDFAWWRERLSVASRCYHLYRIDHIIGFFRIWAVPLDESAKEGHYLPKEPEAWLPQGEKLLSMMLEATTMLPIGEDLGSVPMDVREKMREMGICGTRVMRWERSWDEGRRFLNGQEYWRETMATVSTHDSETLAQWWNSGSDEVKELASQRGWGLGPMDQATRFSLLHDSHSGSSVFHVNLLQEYLSLIDEYGWDDPDLERVNLPGELIPQNWSTRYRVPVEEFSSNETLTLLMKCLRGPSSS